MPTLRGKLDLFNEMPAEACRWCGELTLTWLEPAEGSEIGLIPLHAVCGAEVIEAYHRLRSGRILAPADRDRLAALTE